MNIFLETWDFCLIQFALFILFIFYMAIILCCRKFTWMSSIIYSCICLCSRAEEHARGSLTCVCVCVLCAASDGRTSVLPETASWFRQKSHVDEYKKSLAQMANVSQTLYELNIY